MGLGYPRRVSSTALVLSTAPDRATAERLARGLVEAGLAACVSIGAPCRSIYRWEGAVCEADELPLTIKTSTERANDVEAWLVAHHPYEVPEVLVVGTEGGLAAYRAWVDESTRHAGTARR